MRGGRDIREAHLGRIAEVHPDGLVEVDAGALVRRLILFEQCVLESVRLKELPALVAVFGAEGLIELIDDGALSIVCDALTVAEIGRTSLKVTDRRGGPLAAGSYRLTPVSMTDREEYVHRVLPEAHRVPIRYPEVKRLKKDLSRRLLAYPRTAAESAVATTNAELLARPNLIAEAVQQVAIKELGRDPGPILIRAEPLAFEGDFRVWTSLEQETQIEPELVDAIVRRGLLAAAGLNQRVHLMEEFEALTGFDDAEVPIFARRLSLLADALDPSAQESRFDRVLSIAGLPDLRHLGPGIDVEQLLQLRSQPELKEFRAWLRTIDMASDDDIARRFGDVRARVAEVFQSRVGKAVRFVATGAVGLAGLIPGVAVSAADTFLVDRLLGRPGPAAFISHWYPSIFRQDDFNG